MSRLLVGMYKLPKPFSSGYEPPSGPGAHTYFDTKRRACPEPAAFFSQRTRITASVYVYTSFVSDLVLSKSVAVGRTSRQTLLLDRLQYWPHIAVRSPTYRKSIRTHSNLLARYNGKFYGNNRFP